MFAIIKFNVCMSVKLFSQIIRGFLPLEQWSKHLKDNKKYDVEKILLKISFTKRTGIK